MLCIQKLSGRHRTKSVSAPPLMVVRYMHLLLSYCTGASRNDPLKIVQEYILPKYADHRPGRVRVKEEILAPDDDVLRMSTERISVPELLFRPSDIGWFFVQIVHSVILTSIFEQDLARWDCHWQSQTPSRLYL